MRTQHQHPSKLPEFLKSEARATLDDEHGATAVEYGLMVALIAIVIVAAVEAVGVSLFDIFNDVRLTLALN